MKAHRAQSTLSSIGRPYGQRASAAYRGRRARVPGRLLGPGGARRRGLLYHGHGPPDLARAFNQARGALRRRQDKGRLPDFAVDLGLGHQGRHLCVCVCVCVCVCNMYMASGTKDDTSGAMLRSGIVPPPPRMASKR